MSFDDAKVRSFGDADNKKRELFAQTVLLLTCVNITSDADV